MPDQLEAIMRIAYEPRTEFWHVVDWTDGVIAKHRHYSDAVADLRRMRGT